MRIRNYWISLILLGTASPSFANISVYTSLAESACSKPDVDSSQGEPFSTSVCPGLAGYTLKFLDGDLRQTLAVITPSQDEYYLDVQSFVTVAPNYLRNVAEWRFKTGDKNPSALIFRVQYQATAEDLEKRTYSGNVLVVAKLGSSSACIVGKIDARKDSSANVHARTMADQATTLPCLGKSQN